MNTKGNFVTIDLEEFKDKKYKTVEDAVYDLEASGIDEDDIEIDIYNNGNYYGNQILTKTLTGAEYVYVMFCIWNRDEDNFYQNKEQYYNTEEEAENVLKNAAVGNYSIDAVEQSLSQTFETISRKDITINRNESINSRNTKLQIKESNDAITVNEAVLGDLEKFIEKKLDEDSLWVSDINVYSERNRTINIDISIEWGDWKHEHLRLDHLMYDIIYEYNRDLAKSFYKVNEETTDEDDSDTYSAIHKYVIELQ